MMALISEGVAKLLQREGQVKTVMAERPEIRVVSQSTSRSSSRLKPINEYTASAVEQASGQADPRSLAEGLRLLGTKVGATVAGERLKGLLESPIATGLFGTVLTGGLIPNIFGATIGAKTTLTPEEESTYKDIIGVGQEESIWKPVRDVTTIKENIQDRIERTKESIKETFVSSVTQPAGNWWEANKKYVLYGALGIAGLWLAGKYVSSR
jgi:hypothetical protein